MKYIVFFPLILFFSCKNYPKVYYYNKIDKNDSILSYSKKEFYKLKNHTVLDSTFIYARDHKLIHKFTNKKIFKGHQVIKNGDVFFISEKCSVNKKKARKICYKGQRDTIIRGLKYKNLKKFLIINNLVDGIDRVEFYDSDFNLIMAEYKSGFGPYFKIQSVEKKDWLK